MPYSLFHSRFPEIAELETRTVTVFDNANFNLPAAEYSFLEMFCDDPGCDCRRVIFTVTSSAEKDTVAVIAWGWELRAFYIKWMRYDDPNIINELMGPSLNFGSRQASFAPALVKLFQDVLLPDVAYTQRVKRHYYMFREAVDKKAGKKRK